MQACGHLFIKGRNHLPASLADQYRYKSTNDENIDYILLLEIILMRVTHTHTHTNEVSFKVFFPLDTLQLVINIISVNINTLTSFSPSNLYVFVYSVMTLNIMFYKQLNPVRLGLPTLAPS